MSPASGLAEGPLASVALWLACVLVLLATVRGLRNPDGHRRRTAWLALASVMAAVLLLEAGTRVLHRVVKGIPLLVPLRGSLDGEMGWRARETLGDPRSPRPRLAVIGDSFTEGVGVPAAERYPAVLGAALDAEMFVSAGGGYGTLQERLALERLLERVTPDLVLLQVHSNDLINNDWGLERASRLNNNHAVRPYLVDGRIEYHFPARGSRLRVLLALHSRLFAEITLRVDRLESDLARRGLLGTVERTIEREGPRHPGLARAAHTTASLVARIRERAQPAALVAFPADDAPPYFEALRGVFAREGVPFLDDVPAELARREAGGASLRLADGAHWNPLGHRLCGDLLAERLRARGFASRSRAAAPFPPSPK
jgi:lysophospholipase L1-like esterase